MKDTWILHGAELKYESRRGVQSYQRMRVDCCPTHGKECGKSRAFNANFGKATGLGDQEPFAYLGCWLKLGEDRGRFPDAESHKRSGWGNKKGPSVEEVQTYARSMGWLPPPPGPGPGH